MEGPNGDRIVSLKNQIERLRYADIHFVAEQRPGPTRRIQSFFD